MEPAGHRTEGGAEDEPAPGRLQRVPWGLLEALLLVVGVFLLSQVWLALQAILAGAGVARADILERVFLPVMFLVMGGPPAVWLALRYRDGLRRLFGTLEQPLTTLVTGLLLGAGVLVLTRLALAALLLIAGGGELPDLPEVQPGYEELARDPVMAPWFLATAVLVAPVAEEILFRGVLFQALRDRLGLWPGIGLSSLAFTVLHMFQPTLQASLLVFLLIFPLSMFLAWVFQREGSLAVPIAVHAAYNLIGVVLFRMAG